MSSDATQPDPSSSSNDKPAPADREAMMSAVYDELRRIAGARLRAERSGHTLQPTALVNEACLRLLDQRRLDWNERDQVMATAATAMRRILVDHARSRNALVRGGGRERVAIELADGVAERGAPVDVLEIDDALERLAAIDPTLVQVVELRYFAGMPLDQVASVLGIGRRSADRAWAMARAWLFRELGEGNGATGADRTAPP